MKENFATISVQKSSQHNVFFLVPGVVLLPFINLKIPWESRVSFYCIYYLLLFLGHAGEWQGLRHQQVGLAYMNLHKTIVAKA